MYAAQPAAIVSMSLISPRISNSIMSYRYYDIPFCYGEPPNESVEKSQTTENCPNWGCQNGSSIRDRRLNAKCGGRFFCKFFDLPFSAASTQSSAGASSDRSVAKS